MGATPITAPRGLMGLAVLGTVVPVSLALRSGAVELAGARE